jgi:hypothetical protein
MSKIYWKNNLIRGKIDPKIEQKMRKKKGFSQMVKYITIEYKHIDLATFGDNSVLLSGW